MRFLRVIRLLLALLSNGVFATLVVEVRCATCLVGELECAGPGVNQSRIAC